eukprot:TRINITY_DN5661_c0_g1_i1.p2 TRINITY_DN5661_c0_g1~~TRINITY_DN5661_c0_g1_i1.p2  ORF type:complete len:199 (+),score=55.74 TRINITY_DN5661_c0_g1_i1:67-597(+)
MGAVFGRTHAKVAMLGLDGAGKTTALCCFKGLESVATLPTLGFNVETLNYKRVRFCMWDIGGQDRLRPLWKHYYEGCQGIVLVVDSADSDRLGTVRSELFRMLADEALSAARLLVLANKRDLPGAMGTVELTDRLDLHSLRRPWHVQATCATTGEGLFEGLDWLSKELRSKGRRRA